MSTEQPDTVRIGTRLKQRSKRAMFVGALALWLVATTGVITLLNWQHPHTRAVLGMGWGLILLWIFLGGSLMHHFRDPIRAAVLRINLDWRLKFVLFATALALIEEAITTTMTNLAPWFGVNIGEAYITASTNYLDVVGLHSVVVANFPEASATGSTILSSRAGPARIPKLLCSGRVKRPIRLNRKRP